MDRRLQEPKGWKGGPVNIWSTSSKSHWETPQTCDYIWSNSIRNQVKLGTCGNTTVWENSWWWDEINIKKLSQKTKSYKSFHSSRYYKKELKYWKTEESNNLTILKFWFFQTASIHNLPVTERKKKKKSHCSSLEQNTATTSYNLMWTRWSTWPESWDIISRWTELLKSNLFRKLCSSGKSGIPPTGKLFREKQWLLTLKPKRLFTWSQSTREGNSLWPESQGTNNVKSRCHQHSLILWRGTYVISRTTV